MDRQGIPKRDQTSDHSLLCLLKTSLSTDMSTKPTKEREKGEKRHNLIFSQLSTLGAGEGHSFNTCFLTKYTLSEKLFYFWYVVKAIQTSLCSRVA